MAGSDELPTLTKILEGHVGSVSIQSTAFPKVYLRADGATQVVNLQLGLSKWESYELIPQPEAEYGPEVFKIRSRQFPDYFLYLDPTVFPEQAPKEGTTFHPKGVGKCSLVGSIDKASRFKAVVNPLEIGAATYTVSLKLIYTPAPAEPKNLYLRLDGTDSDSYQGPGSGEVNGQTSIGPFERLLVERFT